MTVFNEHSNAHYCYTDSVKRAVQKPPACFSAVQCLTQWVNEQCPIDQVLRKVIKNDIEDNQECTHYPTKPTAIGSGFLKNVIIFYTRKSL